MIGSILAMFIVAVALLSPSVANQPAGTRQTIHVAPTPRPTPRPTPKPMLPAPTALHYTTNPDSCVHGGEGPTSCSWLTHGKAVAFYWSWECSGKNCAIGGYHLRLPGAGHAGSADGKIVNSSTGRLVLVDQPGGGWHGRCYVVSAYPLSPRSTAESKPSRQICIHDTSKTVTIKPYKDRGYSRQYWVLYSDNNPQVKTSPARGGSDLIVGGIFDNTNQSQVNTFQRAAYAFDLSSIGGNSLFGGSFAYDPGPGAPTKTCAELHRAPNGWASANWIAPTDRPVPERVWNGSTWSWPIDRLVEGWNRSTPLALFLEEIYGVGPAESTKSSVVPYSLTCLSTILRPRLILKVGVTI
jgi:hypothetical protein